MKTYSLIWCMFPYVLEDAGRARFTVCCAFFLSGGATVVSGLLYYLLRETTDTREPSETKTTAEEEDSQGKKNLCLSADTVCASPRNCSSLLSRVPLVENFFAAQITKDEFVELLNSLISSQDSMKAVLKNLIQSFRCRDIT